MIFTEIFTAFLIVFIGIHGVYPYLLRVLPHKKEAISGTNHHGGLPSVSIIVAVFNEAKAIEQRIRNLLDSDYSAALEIIIVDSGSTDGTSLIIKERNFSKVKLIEEDARKGKAHAINLGLRNSNAEIVILTDAPTLYHKNTISEIVKSFNSPDIGAVSVVYEIPNAAESNPSSYELVYWSHKEKIRMLESRVQSTSWLSGEACAFRRNIITNLSEDTVADDTHIALQVIYLGFRAIVTDKTSFTERSPTKSDEYIRVKSRRALGGIQELLRFKSFFLNFKYGYFGLLIFPYRVFAELISPLVFLVLLCVLPLAIIEVFAINLYVGFFALFILVLFPLLLGKKLISLLYVQLISLRAIFLLITGRKDVNWEKSVTTR
jgi:poly-beta-1,6-N-acetyl-D-glucosamine synthase